MSENCLIAMHMMILFKNISGQFLFHCQQNQQLNYPLHLRSWRFAQSFDFKRQQTKFFHLTFRLLLKIYIARFYFTC